MIILLNFSSVDSSRIEGFDVVLKVARTCEVS